MKYFYPHWNETFVVLLLDFFKANEMRTINIIRLTRIVY